jgi:hypothetical protein
MDLSPLPNLKALRDVRFGSRRSYSIFQDFEWLWLPLVINQKSIRFCDEAIQDRIVDAEHIAKNLGKHCCHNILLDAFFRVSSGIKVAAKRLIVASMDCELFLIWLFSSETGRKRSRCSTSLSMYLWRSAKSYMSSNVLYQRRPFSFFCSRSEFRNNLIVLAIGLNFIVAFALDAGNSRFPPVLTLNHRLIWPALHDRQ